MRTPATDCESAQSPELAPVDNPLCGASSAGSRTRDRIVAAAVNLLVDEGPTAFTVAAVARVARVSKGGLLYHFRTQRDLALEIVERSIARLNRLAAERCSLGASAVPSEGAFDAEVVAGLLLSMGTEPGLRQSLARAWGGWHDPTDRTALGNDCFGQAAVGQLAQWLLRYQRKSLPRA